MLRILFFLVVVFLLGLGFAWLAERPGDLVITFGGYRYEVTLMVATVLALVAILAVMLLWWLLRSLWNSPYAVARYWRARRRDKGYQALSTGLVAAGAGDGGLALRMGKQAAKLLPPEREPLIHLLDAQAAMLEGDHDAARIKFAAMAENPETRLLGLRGLYLEASRLGEREAARHYAAEAARAAPQLAWALDATLEARTEEGDWQGALALLDMQRPRDKPARQVLDRRRAVLLTAQAMEELDADPAAARAAALEAHRLRPDFVPAAVTAARALFRQEDLRRGSKVLEAMWKIEPHPEVADVYVHARSGDSTHDRLERARRLVRLRANHVESELVLARAALDAGEFEVARRAAEAAVRIAPREGTFLLLADIEEAETGDQGRVRHWLARAVRAPRDPAWVADGYVSERWAPISPVTGRFDAFEWRMPVERLGQVLEGEEALAALPPVEVVTPPAPPVEEAEVVTLDAEPAPSPEGEAVGEPDAETPSPEEPRPAEEEPRPAEEAAPKPPQPGAPKAPNGEAKTRVDGGDGPEPAPPIPDDPGVEPDEAETEAQRRYRLF